MALCVAGVLGWVTTVQAQAPVPQAKPKGGAPRALGMEDGLTYFQTKCMSCHRESDSTKAPSARRIRQLTPEQIYAVVTKPGRVAYSVAGSPQPAVSLFKITLPTALETRLAAGEPDFGGI